MPDAEKQEPLLTADQRHVVRRLALYLRLVSLALGLFGGLQVLSGGLAVPTDYATCVVGLLFCFISSYGLYAAQDFSLVAKKNDPGMQQLVDALNTLRGMYVIMAWAMVAAVVLAVAAILLSLFRP